MLLPAWSWRRHPSGYPLFGLFVFIGLNLGLLIFLVMNEPGALNWTPGDPHGDFRIPEVKDPPFLFAGAFFCWVGIASGIFLLLNPANKLNAIQFLLYGAMVVMALLALILYLDHSVHFLSPEEWELRMERLGGRG